MFRLKLPPQSSCASWQREALFYPLGNIGICCDATVELTRYARQNSMASGVAPYGISLA